MGIFEPVSSDLATYLQLPLHDSDFTYYSIRPLNKYTDTWDLIGVCPISVEPWLFQFCLVHRDEEMFGPSGEFEMELYSSGFIYCKSDEYQYIVQFFQEFLEKGIPNGITNNLRRFLSANQADSSGFSFAIDDLKAEQDFFYAYMQKEIIRQEIYVVGFPHWRKEYRHSKSSLFQFTNLHEQYKNNYQLHVQILKTVEGPHCITFDEEGYVEFLFLLKKYRDYI
jgi:hypothetical protein